VLSRWVIVLATVCATVPTLAESVSGQPPSGASARIIANAFDRCYRRFPDLGEPAEWFVTFRARYDAGGTLLGVPQFVEGSEAFSNRRFLVFSDSAYRSLWKCNPLPDLDEADYEGWRELLLTFTPAGVRVDN